MKEKWIHFLRNGGLFFILAAVEAVFALKKTLNPPYGFVWYAEWFDPAASALIGLILYFLGRKEKS